MSGRDRGFGGRVLSRGRGAPRGLRPSPGNGMGSLGGTRLALRRLRPKRDTPTPHHPPEMPLWLALLQLKRRRSYARQPNVSWQGFRGRRLQQLREKLQGHEAGNHHCSSFGRKLPANA